MRILRHGSASPDREIKVTCSDCGCVFVVTVAETAAVKDKENPSVKYRTVSCPDCKRRCRAETVK